MSNENNGLITKIWGPNLWQSLHSIAFGYPLTPTEEQKQQYKQFFMSLGNVLPCIYCRISYNEFTTGKTKEGNPIPNPNLKVIITDDIFENRESLTRWMYELHERVNKKLDVDYKVKYEDVVMRFESFRAVCSPDKKGCIMPLDKKAQSYSIAGIIECPIIPSRLARKFIEYAKERGLKCKYTDLFTKYSDEELDEKITERMTENWYKRNKNCRRIMTHMRKKGIPMIEPEGTWMGMPTIHELKLIMMLSSNICLTKLEEIGVSAEKGLRVKCVEDH